MPPIPPNNNSFYPNFWNLPPVPMTTGLATGGQNTSYPLLRMPQIYANQSHSSPHWCPSPSEIQIWVAPAGWAEAAYLNNQPIDVRDELTFLDQVRSQEVEIKSTFETVPVQMTGGQTGVVARKPVTKIMLYGIFYHGPENTYNKMFPLDEKRDILLLVTSDKGTKLVSVISNVMVYERELLARADDHSLFESMTLMGENYYPLKEST